MKGKSTEDLELEKMQQLQQEVSELRRKNEESLKAAIAGPGKHAFQVAHILERCHIEVGEQQRSNNKLVGLWVQVCLIPQCCPLQDMGNLEMSKKKSGEEIKARHDQILVQARSDPILM